MRSAQIVVGGEYALVGWQFERGDAAQVRVEAEPFAGQVRVSVLTCRSGRLEVGTAVTVATRDLRCTWTDWLAEAAGRPPFVPMDERVAEQTRLEPARPLPGRYDPTDSHLSPRPESTPPDEAFVAALVDHFDKPFRPTHPQVAARLLEGLPTEVARDLVAATLQAESPSGHASWPWPTPDPTTVSAAMARPAALMRLAWLALAVRHHPGLPRRALTAQDADLILAAQVQLDDDGAVLDLPWVPDLPMWARVDPSHGLGWLRIAVAFTTGQRVHTPGCHSVGDEELETAESVPLWEAWLLRREDLCVVCGGPTLISVTPVLHLAVAADVWMARGRGRLERWQLAAVSRLLAEAAKDRARVDEPDRTLLGRLVHGLSADQPGEAGKPIDRMLHPSWHAPALKSHDAETARAQAVARLNQAAHLLPTGHRPMLLPPSADVATIRVLEKEIVTQISSRLLTGATSVETRDLVAKRLLWSLP